ncbi:uncharacterized protein LOC110648962 [Hevea brasiliensis]|uniref:uncharacterized protein LOC110648962 n=1 Tax=Hevea brasiliensis TaxID=3981 RepID=UPI0025F3711A|nr:uncharacterized protein LOC110648962 [Hevea brasiliensis]
MVLSWITHSLSHSIAQSILWIDTAIEVWKDLQDRFSQGDIFCILDLQEEIYAFKQGDLSVTDYSTQLKIIWDELENFRPIPQCSCPTHCSCGALTTVKTYRHNDYVIRFLKGLNDQFTTVKSQIMLLESLPSINKVFSLVIQQERQLNSGLLIEPKILVNITNNFQNNVLTQQSNFQKNVFGKGTAVESVNNRKSSSQNDNKVCTYRGRPRHTEETCYRKHGFPPGFKFKNSSGAVINNISSYQTEDSKGFDSNEKSATQPLPQ